MEMTINLKSNNFGADNKIVAFATLHQNETYRKQHNISSSDNEPASKQYLLNFDGTYCNPGKNPYARIQQCQIKLTRSNDESYYFGGPTALFYSYGGTFDISLSYDDENDVTPTKVGKGFITIDSLTSTNTFRTFKVTFFIGVIAALIGFTNWYQNMRRRR